MQTNSDKLMSKRASVLLNGRWLLLTIIATIFANMAYAASELPATIVEQSTSIEQPTNVIWYTSSNGEIVTPNKADVFGATIISNKRYTYSNGAIRCAIVFDKAVTEIGERAFYGCDNLTTITIPDSVTEIGEYAFCSCSNLTSITIPDSVTVVGVGTFMECESLTDITIGDGVNEIGKWAFYKCDNLPTVTIPDNVTEIGEAAFYGCESLTSITIPNSVTKIWNGAFMGCVSLTSITIPDSVAEIERGAFAYCISLKVFKGKYAADSGRCLIKDNTIIAYANASGATYTIPDSVTEIGVGAFYCCKSLTSIAIPNSVTEIGEWVFCGCDSLASITIPDSVTKIGMRAFSGCDGLTSVAISDSVTEIGERAFLGCRSLKEFKGKNTSDDGRCLIMNNAVIAYAEASGTTYTIPDGVMEIGDLAFEDCFSLTSINIPNSVTEIGVGAFLGCDNLASITIPDSVTEIGPYAFDSCSRLESVYCKATTPPTVVVLFKEDSNWDTFNRKADGRKIYVPRGSVEEYKNADGWKEYADDIVGYDF